MSAVNLPPRAERPIDSVVSSSSMPVTSDRSKRSGYLQVLEQNTKEGFLSCDRDRLILIQDVGQFAAGLKGCSET
jgi:hypothetical protein